ncbi:hypothetical protein BP5796_07018 [Coleophoma crateriformis]|uniref:FAD protein n=1 Tax=Coleophoma crateriformis TaxID=565419 RepID=A0A3D8RQ38_9HELO|nr:hypothetical protein BP5796_07018 [Coleophoma crateriformis]
MPAVEENTLTALQLALEHGPQKNADANAQELDGALRLESNDIYQVHNSSCGLELEPLDEKSTQLIGTPFTNSTEQDIKALPSNIPTATKQTFSVEIPDRYHSEPHHVKIIHVGAGASGLLTAYKAKRMLTNYELVVYEKNATIGGTWLENTYPGVACDVPSHQYSFGFEPNPDWSAFFAYGAEIQDYFVRFYEKYKLQEYMRFDTKVLCATWHEAEGQYPDVDGLASFKGTLTHSAHWDNSIDWTGKRVAVIGSGASAIQLMPQLANGSQSLTVFARNPTWVIPNILDCEPVHPDGIKAAGAGKHHYVEKEIELFRTSPEALVQYRKKLESGLIALWPVFHRGSPTNTFFRQTMETITKARLGEANERLRKFFIPDWSPGCRRITPSDEFLEKLLEPHVELVQDEISHFTEKGIQTMDGKEREFDIIACATGFDIAFTPHFKLVGVDGAVIQQDWKENPNIYLSITGPKFPNYFVINGPRGNWNQGSNLLSHEVQVEYALKCVRKIQTENIRALEVKQGPTTQLNEYIDAWHAQKSIWAENCRSWYKKNTAEGRVFIWCGNMPHLLKSLKNPRFEDYDIRYRAENMWNFLGDGSTVLDSELAKGKPVDVAPYVRTHDHAWDIDLPITDDN